MHDDTPNAVIETELPSSVSLAAQMTGLDAFLENAPVGFHWEILDRLEDGVYIVDGQRRILYWSAGAERITGYPAVEVLGRSCRDGILQHVDLEGRRLCGAGCPLAAIMADGKPRSAEVFLHHRDGHRVPVRVQGLPLYNSDGRIVGAFETFSSVTARSADLERIRDLEHVAFLDPLTGLANRRYLESTVASRLAEYAREGIRFGLIVGDIDHFKRFNDEHGHEAGDAVLKTVAQTLSGACRAYDLPSRWGGEEFVILIGTGSTEAVSRAAERFRVLVEASEVRHEGKVLRVTLSLGGTLVHAGDDARTLFARADKLLYECKSGGRNRTKCME